MLHGFNEDLTVTLAALAGLCLVDHLLVRTFLNTKSRWFAVHAFGNAIVVYFALPEVIQTLRDPLVAFSGPMASMVPNSTVSAIHLYHCLFFKLRADDWFHHMTSLPVPDSQCPRGACRLHATTNHSRCRDVWPCART